MNGISGVPNLPRMPQVDVTPAGNPAAKEGFGSVLKDAIDQVDQLNSTAQQEVGSLITGDKQDVHNVMIAVEKADVAFQLMMQVRNKIVNAYQEVSRMQF